MGEDQAPDAFGDGGDDGVAEGGDTGAVQFGGNPISHSICAGSGRHEPIDWITPRTLASVAGEYRPPVPNPQPRRPIDAVGVGQYEQASSWVWGTQGARWYNRPFDSEPASGKVVEDDRKRFHVPQQRGDVLDEDVSRSNSVQGVSHPGPSPAGIADAATESG